MKTAETLVVIGLVLLGLIIATLSQVAADSTQKIGAKTTVPFEAQFEAQFEARNVAGGRYIAVTPEGASTAQSLPVMFFYHGYGQSAETVKNNRSLLKLVSDRGILLVIPDGINRSWSTKGAPSAARDDLKFTQDILHDVKANWKIQKDKIWATGFSLGASMTWDIACYMGEDFSAFFPIAGSFWRPHPVTCNSPVNIKHIHGLSDRVVPMKGRPIGSRWHQGDVRQGVAIWESVNGCEVTPTEISLEDMSCTVWRNCRSGKALELCLHEGGHSVKTEWIARGIDWAKGL